MIFYHSTLLYLRFGLFVNLLSDLVLEYLIALFVAGGNWCLCVLSDKHTALTDVGQKTEVFLQIRNRSGVRDLFVSKLLILAVPQCLDASVL